MDNDILLSSSNKTFYHITYREVVEAILRDKLCQIERWQGESKSARKLIETGDIAFHICCSRIPKEMHGKIPNS